jgi:hypothetical protein
MIHRYKFFIKSCGFPLLIVGCLLISSTSVFAQTSPTRSGIRPLRSDVGINGFTANFGGLAWFKNLSTDSLGHPTPLYFDGSKELEIVFHDVRMMSPRLGVGFQVLGSFFTNNNPAHGHSSFGLGSCGLGPMVRLYPFFTNRFQPYVQAKALFGDNMGVGKLDNTSNRANGFRLRLGLRAGFALRIINNFGLFASFGPDWESSALFKADAMAWQLNIGFDIYRFK